METIDLAAHVDHQVTHASSTARIVLGITFAALGVGIAVAIIAGGAAPAAVVGAGVWGASAINVSIPVIVSGGSYGGLGMDIGKEIDKYLAPSPAGKLVSGYPTVLLGPDLKQAARADAADTVASCEPIQVAEGSKIVMLGPESKPMSRRQDRLKCGGVISQGIRTILVGGDPSLKGQPIAEKDRLAVKALTLLFDLTGVLKSGAKKTLADTARAVAKAGAAAATATDHKEAAAALKTAAMSPADLKRLRDFAAGKMPASQGIDLYSSGKTGAKGIGAGAALVMH